MSNPKELKLKIIGKTVFITINNKKLQANLDAEAKNKLKANIERYNKNQTEFWLNKIIKAFASKEMVNKEKVKAKKIKSEVKEVKRTNRANKEQIKAQEEVVKLLTDEEKIAQLTSDPTKQMKIAALLKAEEVKAVPTPVRNYARPGEY